MVAIASSLSRVTLQIRCDDVSPTYQGNLLGALRTSLARLCFTAMTSAEPPSSPPPIDEEPVERERHVRGKALVAKVLAAAIAELPRLGYEKLSMEDIAIAAGVNKTTVYRRWATKRDLILEALAKVMEEILPPADHGNLRLDMLSEMQRHRDLLKQPAIRGLMRMSFGAPPPPEIAEYAETVRAEKEEQGLLVYMRGIARGELPPNTDIRLLRSIVAGTMTELVLSRPEDCDDAKLAKIVDMVLDGAIRASAPAA